MLADKTDIIARLKREILPLEGLRSLPSGSENNLGLGFLSPAFPQGSFPLGAVHEMISMNSEAAASTVGFMAGLLSGLMKTGGAAVWIGSSGIIFPPALKAFGITPDQIIFIDLKNQRDLLWAMEEALKCEGLAAVVGELADFSFTASRRFQLAVEQSRVTGFILRSRPRNLNANACVSRWQIKPLSTDSADDIPGLGFPRWQVDLLKIRNGTPGSWQMEWANGRFHHYTEKIPSILTETKRKTG